jgi:hypothetical protein
MVIHELEATPALQLAPLTTPFASIVRGGGPFGAVSGDSVAVHVPASPGSRGLQAAQLMPGVVYLEVYVPAVIWPVPEKLMEYILPVTSIDKMGSTLPTKSAVGLPTHGFP